MGQIFQKTLFWSFNFKIWEEVPNGAKNNKTKSCSDKITFLSRINECTLIYVEQSFCCQYKHIFFIGVLKLFEGIFVYTAYTDAER